MATSDKKYTKYAKKPLNAATMKFGKTAVKTKRIHYMPHITNIFLYDKVNTRLISMKKYA